MDKKTIENEIKELTEQLDKQIKTLKGKAVDAYENEKVQAVLNKIKTKTVDFLELVKDKATNLWDYYSDPEEIAKIVKSIKVISKNVYDASVAKFNEVKNNKDVQKAVASAEDFIKKTYDKTSEFTKEQVDKVMENENVKKAIDGAVSTYDNVKDIVTDYFEKPEVQANIEGAKEVVVDLAQKSIDALSKWLKNNKKEK